MKWGGHQRSCYPPLPPQCWQQWGRRPLLNLSAVDVYFLAACCGVVAWNGAVALKALKCVEVTNYGQTEHSDMSFKRQELQKRITNNSFSIDGNWTQSAIYRELVSKYLGNDEKIELHYHYWVSKYSLCGIQIPLLGCHNT